MSESTATIEKDLQQNTTEPEILNYKHPVVKNRKIFWIGKRVFDVIASGAALLVLSVPMAIVALLIYIDDPHGSPIFSQERIGRKGVPFKMYKFRSMVVNAEDLLDDLQELNEADGPAFKIKDDPRITKIGKFIRKTSIDELPQLFNVLKGDMSVVGPRPALRREVEQYDEYMEQRLTITPGLTCYWQIAPGRNDLTFEEWMDLDIKYIYTRNWRVDFKIMLQTALVMLTGQGR